MFIDFFVIIILWSRSMLNEQIMSAITLYAQERYNFVKCDFLSICISNYIDAIPALRVNLFLLVVTFVHD